ncbi:hypothetical protein LX36DRAFT_665107 [Colletotrichum falcatum]|nr:hypothetical protein LX36DRAFT_665107 [Colletotrichum falcatum]
MNPVQPAQEIREESAESASATDKYPEYGNHRDDPAERRHIIPNHSPIAYLAQRINPRLWGEITIKDIPEGIPTAQRRRALNTIAIGFIADILRDDPVGPGL